MRARWEQWVRFCDRPIDCRPLAMIRILVPLCVIGDLLQMAQLGLVTTFYRPQAIGGLVPAPHRWNVWDLSAEWGGLVTYGVTLVAMALVSVGFYSRISTIVAVAASANLAVLVPHSDRAIDDILRTVLLILLFTNVHRCWSLTGKATKLTAGWPSDLLLTLLALIYMSAGVGKIMQNTDWVTMAGTPVLYRVMADPAGGNVDESAGMAWFGLFRILGLLTIVVECVGFLAWTRWRSWWALTVAPIHIGIAMTMKLGMFSYGMLALYPVLFAP